MARGANNQANGANLFFGSRKAKRFDDQDRLVQEMLGESEALFKAIGKGDPSGLAGFMARGVKTDLQPFLDAQVDAEIKKLLKRAAFRGRFPDINESFSRKVQKRFSKSVLAQNFKTIDEAYDGLSLETDDWFGSDMETIAIVQGLSTQTPANQRELLESLALAARTIQLEVPGSEPLIENIKNSTAIKIDLICNFPENYKFNWNHLTFPSLQDRKNKADAVPFFRTRLPEYRMDQKRVIKKLVEAKDIKKVLESIKQDQDQQKTKHFVNSLIKHANKKTKLFQSLDPAAQKQFSHGINVFKTSRKKTSSGVPKLPVKKVLRPALEEFLSSKPLSTVQQEEILFGVILARHWREWDGK